MRAEFYQHSFQKGYNPDKQADAQQSASQARAESGALPKQHQVNQNLAYQLDEQDDSNKNAVDLLEQLFIEEGQQSDVRGMLDDTLKIAWLFVPEAISQNLSILFQPATQFESAAKPSKKEVV